MRKHFARFRDEFLDLPLIAAVSIIERKREREIERSFRNIAEA